jgi:hypothetical protein
MSELVCRTLELLAETKDSFVSAVKNIFDTRTMATLKITDLSVGDWVRVINQFDAQIDGYHSGSGSLSLKTRQGNLVHYRLEDIHFIPITPETLEKNGFENMGSGLMRYEFELREKKYKIILGSLDEEVWFADFYFMRKKNINSNMPLFYIHQLQHILRLAGVEKEINL